MHSQIKFSFFLICCTISLHSALCVNVKQRLTLLKDQNDMDDTVTLQKLAAFHDVIITRIRRQLSLNAPQSKSATTSSASSSVATSVWSPWEPAVRITCSSGVVPKPSNSICAQTHAQLEQKRKCQQQNGSGLQKIVADGNCLANSAGGAARNLSCGTLDICGNWSSWSKWFCCNSTTCNYGTFNLTRGYTGRYRTRSCNEQLNVDASCTQQVQTKRKCITSRGALPGGANNPSSGTGTGGGGTINVGPKPNARSTNPFSALVKIIVFSVAGVVMVGLLAFAATRLSKNVKLPLARSRGRHQSSTLEADDIQYSSVSHDSAPTSPRVIIVNQAQMQQIRRQGQGRRRAPPNSNLSVIREEEADDVFEEEREHSIVSSGVSYDDEDAVSRKSDRDCDEALNYMDGIINEISDSDEVFDDDDDDYDANSSEEILTKISKFMPRKAYRQSVETNFLSDFGWKPRHCLTAAEPIRLEPLKDSPGEGFLSASALSLASEKFLSQSPTANRYLTSSMSSSFYTEDESLYSDSIISSSSLKDVRRIPARLNALKHFSSMPDMTKAAETIPDVGDVLNGSTEPW